MKNNVRIAKELVRLAKSLVAKFSLNYDTLVRNRQGVFIELDGNLDYDTISGSLDGEKENLKSLADELSQVLIDNKGKLEQLKDMKVDSIDSGKYKIVHDEHKNKIYLFLPDEALHVEEKKSEVPRFYIDGAGEVDRVTNYVSNGMFNDQNYLAKKEERGNVLVNIAGPVEMYAVINTYSEEDDDDEYKCDANFSLARNITKRGDGLHTVLQLTVNYSDGDVNEQIYAKEISGNIDLAKYGVQIDDYSSRNGIVFNVKEKSLFGNGERNRRMKEIDKFFDELEKDLNELEKRMIHSIVMDFASTLARR